MYMHLMYLVTSIGCSLHIVHDLISPVGMAIRYGLTVASLVEPTTYREAAAHPDWQHAVSEEIAALDRTGTWDLVPLLPHATPVTFKWVYKIKTRSDGSLECYKARLVARGFQQ